MKVEFPDFFATNLAGAMVERAGRIIGEQGIVPAFMWQYASVWEKGVRYDGADVTFWQAVANHDKNAGKVLDKLGMTR